MPLYEYECEPNKHRFELIRKFSDPPLDACPVCGGAVRKLMSSPAIQFKGSGWYITDYAKKSSTEGTKAGTSKESKDAKESRESKDSSDAAKSDSAKSDSAAKSTESSSTSSTPKTSGSD